MKSALLTLALILTTSPAFAAGDAEAAHLFCDRSREFRTLFAVLLDGLCSQGGGLAPAGCNFALVRGHFGPLFGPCGGGLSRMTLHSPGVARHDVRDELCGPRRAGHGPDHFAFAARSPK